MKGRPPFIDRAADSASQIKQSLLDRPLLVVLVDLEEEFNWREPFRRENVSVTHLHQLPVAQSIFDGFGIRPTYLADYPVVMSDEGAGFLARTYAEGRCELGAQLHPWVNPPYDDQKIVLRAETFQGNLPEVLERQKIMLLTDLIATRCGVRPKVFKAGRYGLGAHTTRIIADLGYRVDTSIMPFTTYSLEGGPDYSRVGAEPFWLHDRALLELPSTRAFTGSLRRFGSSVHPWASGGIGRLIRAGAVLARLGIVERVTLSPEGNGFDDQRRLVDTLLAEGQRVLVFSFHSPSLSPGHTPYVRSPQDLDQFIATIEQLFRYLISTLGVEPVTALQLRERLLQVTEIDPR